MTAAVFIVCTLTQAQSAERPEPTAQAGWDNAVNSLLAAGMYGFSSNAPGLTVQMQHADTSLVGLAPKAARLETQAITFSYEGSSGLLEFSAGYILANQKNGTEQGAVFLGIHPEMDAAFDPSRSWYMALDLSRSYQVDENIAFSFGNTAMLLKNPFDTEEGHIFSILFNMPISYKNYLTVTPALQWSHPVSGSSGSAGFRTSNAPEEQSSQGVLYGGVSISFTY